MTLWVPVLRAVSVTSVLEVPPPLQRKVRMRVVDNDVAIVVAFDWQRLKTPVKKLIPGRCRTLIHADEINQYSIVGWEP